MEHEIGEQVSASLKLKIVKPCLEAADTVYNLPPDSTGIIVDILDEDYIVEWDTSDGKVRSRCYYEYIKIVPELGLRYCVSLAEHAS